MGEDKERAAALVAGEEGRPMKKPYHGPRGTTRWIPMVHADNKNIIAEVLKNLAIWGEIVLYIPCMGRKP